MSHGKNGNPSLTMFETNAKPSISCFGVRRLAYNAAFAAFNLKINEEPVVWSTEYYVRK